MASHSQQQAIDPAQVSIELPLFEQFYQRVLAIAQTRAKQALSMTNQNWVEGLNGLIVSPSHHFRNGGYWCTPLNTLAFANTGTDGEHFSFLVQHSRITPDSPVVYTAPMKETGQNNVIIAPNFKIFLRLGIQAGFFDLGNLLEIPSHALQTLSILPKPQKDLDPFDLNEQKTLAAIASHLQLTPYHYSVDDFIALQFRYLPCLHMSQDYLDDCQA